MVFLPGDHLLDASITVANVTELTMLGESSPGSTATIVCQNVSVGFIFTSVIDFKIYSLTFTCCSRNKDNPPVRNYALLLQSTQYTELVNCSFHNNPGTALVVINTTVSLTGNTEFTHNYCTGSNSCVGVGGIQALSSNLTFTGNTTFLGNTAIFYKLYTITSGGHGGAIIALQNTILRFNGTNNFINNSANHGGSGGAIYVSDNTTVSFNGTNNFINNLADDGGIGGAICASNNTVLIFNGASNFINNSAFQGGGAIYTSEKSVLRFNGISKFISNSADPGGIGGAICASNNILSFNGISSFISNSANGGGGAIYISNHTVLSLSGTNKFMSNSAGYGGGGAFYISDSTVLSFNGTNNFTGNSGIDGGAIYTSGRTAFVFNETSSFTSNSAFHSGGAILISENTVISFKGTSNFISNSASAGGAFQSSGVLSFNGTSNFISNLADDIGCNGGAFYTTSNATLSFEGTSNFTNNSAVYDKYGAGGAIYTSDTTMISFSGTCNFISNSATNQGGAIYAGTNTTLTFRGAIHFISNGHNGGRIGTLNSSSTAYGGGVYLGLQSTFSILPNTILYWENNHATLGGAIYVMDAIPSSYCLMLTPKEACFFQLPQKNLSSSDVQFVFKNNSAGGALYGDAGNVFHGGAGSVLYGGAIDNCDIIGLDLYDSGAVFNMLFYIEDDNTNSSISSDPFHICPCENNHSDCTVPEYYVPYTVYPGETFQVSVVAAGQRYGIVSSTVRSIIDQLEGKLLDYQYLQQANNTCTKLNYTVFSLSESVTIELQAEGSPCSKFESTYIYNKMQLVIFVKLNQTCPPGLNISESEKSCVCEHRLAKYTHQCNISNGLEQILRKSGQQFWVGYDNQSDGLILHPHCPFDYCVSHQVVFPLNNTDVQCAYHRSGLLCGACKNGYSLVLGTSQCKLCTNNHLALLILFAVMGVVLVFFLLICKLTVATGTLSGLVFYVNIVGANRAIFLPVKSTDAFSVFITWLNLDLGIETCFYNGMDAYSKTWLQFVFPVYIWVLVVLMILGSRFSHRFANLLGNNPISVLATLLLLSYTKILRTLIAVICVTYLAYPTHNRMVWLYDASVEYLNGKHIPLFLVAVLVFLFLFLPYTLLLLFSQWLQAISHQRLFSWINRVKPLMDSYHAPYKAKHRYWPGLLLMLRFILLLVFALNFQENSSINLLAILVGTGMLHLWAWISGGVYRNWWLDALEGSFALNLTILAAATYHVTLSGGNQLAVGYTSVSIALITSIGILAYHIFQQLRHTKLWKKVSKLHDSEVQCTKHQASCECSCGDSCRSCKL